MPSCMRPFLKQPSTTVHSASLTDPIGRSRSQQTFCERKEASLCLKACSVISLYTIFCMLPARSCPGIGSLPSPYPFKAQSCFLACRVLPLTILSEGKHCQASWRLYAKASESQKANECLLSLRELRGNNSREAALSCRIHSGHSVIVLAEVLNMVAFAKKNAEVIFGPPASLRQNHASCVKALVAI